MYKEYCCWSVGFQDNEDMHLKDIAHKCENNLLACVEIILYRKRSCPHT